MSERRHIGLRLLTSRRNYNCSPPPPLSLSPSFPPLLTILTTLNIYYIFSPFLLPLSPSFIMCVPCPLSSECARYLEARAGVRARIWERLGVCVGVLVCVYVYVGIC